MVASRAGEAQSPNLGASLDIAPSHGLLVGLLDLGQQWQRIMGGEQVQGESRVQGGQGAEDRCMADRMRDHRGVERGDVGVVFVAAAASARGFFLASDLV